MSFVVFITLTGLAYHVRGESLLLIHFSGLFERTTKYGCSMTCMVDPFGVCIFELSLDDVKAKRTVS